MNFELIHKTTFFKRKKKCMIRTKILNNIKSSLPMKLKNNEVKRRGPPQRDTLAVCLDGAVVQHCLCLVCVDNETVQKAPQHCFTSFINHHHLPYSPFSTKINTINTVWLLPFDLS
jgi:hypothetical protein